MCMTSSHPTASGYASPSTLPYTAEELPFSACQLASLGVATSAISALSPAGAAKPAAAVASATSSPTIFPTTTSAVDPPSHCQMPPTPKGLGAATVAATRRRAASRSSSSSLHDLPLPLRKRQCNTPKQRFATFVAILLMHLDGSAGGATAASKTTGIPNKHYKLSIQAKALVAECCRRNQMGDTHFMPLQDSLSERLYGLVGEYHWHRARTYLHIFLARHHGFHARRDEQEEDRRLLRYPKQQPRQQVVVAAPLQQQWL